MAKERREINRILHHLSDLARVEVDNIDNIAAGLVKLDFIQAKARLAQSMRAIEPRLTRDQSLSFFAGATPLD